jgi:hypothetical protein
MLNHFPLGETTLTDYNARIEVDDVSIFSIVTAMSAEDKRSFLKIQNVVRLVNPNYAYLEIGSDLGGSLIAPLMDTHCERAYRSICGAMLSRMQGEGFLNSQPTQANGCVVSYRKLECRSLRFAV